MNGSEQISPTTRIGLIWIIPNFIGQITMQHQTLYITPDIKLSQYEASLFKTEVVFEHHMLVWFMQGEAKIVQTDATYSFGAGDIFLIPRNQLATIILNAKNGTPHKSVVMHLTTERLKNYYSRHTAVANKTIQKPPLQHVRSFSNHPLLASCLASLIPYFDLKDNLPADIASIKIEEAITILRAIDHATDGLLANFADPGKINLAEFMEKNYMFNMTLEKFGYMTGRSLTTFKRDFKKLFHTTPQKWLTQKRLELAHYQLANSRKPVDVFVEAGFENLSHFSYAFKKHFGYSPTELTEQTTR